MDFAWNTETICARKVEAKSEVLLEIKRMSFYKTKPDGFFFHREAESKTLLDMWRETLLRN